MSSRLPNNKRKREADSDQGSAKKRAPWDEPQLPSDSSISSSKKAAPWDEPKQHPGSDLGSTKQASPSPWRTNEHDRFFVTPDVTPKSPPLPPAVNPFGPMPPLPPQIPPLPPPIGRSQSAPGSIAGARIAPLRVQPGSPKPPPMGGRRGSSPGSIPQTRWIPPGTMPPPMPVRSGSPLGTRRQTPFASPHASPNLTPFTSPSVSPKPSPPASPQMRAKQPPLPHSPPRSPQMGAKQPPLPHSPPRSPQMGAQQPPLPPSPQLQARPSPPGSPHLQARPSPPGSPHLQARPSPPASPQLVAKSSPPPSPKLPPKISSAPEFAPLGSLPVVLPKSQPKLPPRPSLSRQGSGLNVPSRLSQESQQNPTSRLAQAKSRQSSPSRSADAKSRQASPSRLTEAASQNPPSRLAQTKAEAQNPPSRLAQAKAETQNPPSRLGLSRLTEASQQNPPSRLSQTQFAKPAHKSIYSAPSFSRLTAPQTPTTDGGNGHDVGNGTSSNEPAAIVEVQVQQDIEENSANSPTDGSKPVFRRSRSPFTPSMGEEAGSKRFFKHSTTPEQAEFNLSLAGMVQTAVSTSEIGSIANKKGLSRTKSGTIVEGSGRRRRGSIAPDQAPAGFEMTSRLAAAGAITPKSSGANAAFPSVESDEVEKEQVNKEDAAEKEVEAVHVVSTDRSSAQSINTSNVNLDTTITTEHGSKIAAPRSKIRSIDPIGLLRSQSESSQEFTPMVVLTPHDLRLRTRSESSLASALMSGLSAREPLGTNEFDENGIEVTGQVMDVENSRNVAPKVEVKEELTESGVVEYDKMPIFAGPQHFASWIPESLEFYDGNTPEDNSMPSSMPSSTDLLECADGALVERGVKREREDELKVTSISTGVVEVKEETGEPRRKIVKLETVTDADMLPETSSSLVQLEVTEDETMANDGLEVTSSTILKTDTTKTEKTEIEKKEEIKSERPQIAEIRVLHPDDATWVLPHVQFTDCSELTDLSTPLTWDQLWYAVQSSGEEDEYGQHALDVWERGTITVKQEDLTVKTEIDAGSTMQTGVNVEDAAPAASSTGAAASVPIKIEESEETPVKKKRGRPAGSTKKKEEKKDKDEGRARSAYQFFCQVTRREKKLKGLATQELGLIWKSMPADDKQRFHEMADFENERRRVKREQGAALTPTSTDAPSTPASPEPDSGTPKKNFVAPKPVGAGSVVKKKRTRKLGGGISPWTEFCHTQRREGHVKGLGTKELAKQWREMDASQKERYEKMAKVARVKAELVDKLTKEEEDDDEGSIRKPKKNTLGHMAVKARRVKHGTGTSTSSLGSGGASVRNSTSSISSAEPTIQKESSFASNISYTSAYSQANSTTNSTASNALDSLFSETAPGANGASSSTDVAQAPQLRLDADGQIIIDNSSIEMADNRNIVSGEARFGGEDVYMEGQRYAGAYKITKPTKWCEQETDKFYDALAQFGEDLFLIQTRFKDKTANQISMKLRSERKRNPKRFNEALDNPKSITKEAWQSDHGHQAEASGWLPNFNPTAVTPKSTKKDKDKDKVEKDEDMAGKIWRISASDRYPHSKARQPEIEKASSTPTKLSRQNSRVNTPVKTVKPYTGSPDRDLPMTPEKGVFQRSASATSIASGVKMTAGTPKRSPAASAPSKQMDDLEKLFHLPEAAVPTPEPTTPQKPKSTEDELLSLFS